MKKAIFLVVALIGLPVFVFAAERIVVLEIFTGTWCPYCPGAAMGADDLVEAYPGKVLVVEYHVGSDPFKNTEGLTRNSFYGDVVYGVPAAIFDGVDTLIGGFADKSLFPWYNPIFNARRAVEPELEITLEKTGESQGTLTATIKNTSDHEITGKAHFTITESNIPYKWRNQQMVHFAERTMLPDASGELITLAPAATTVLERDFEINSSWPYHTGDLGNIEFGCFVQDTTSSGFLREVLQAAMIQLTNPLIEGIEEAKDASPVPFLLDVPMIINAHGYINLSLDGPSTVSLNLYDASGRFVKTLYAGSLSAGRHTIDLAADDLSGGTYFVTASAGGRTELGKLVVVH